MRKISFSLWTALCFYIPILAITAEIAFETFGPSETVKAFVSEDGAKLIGIYGNHTSHKLFYRSSEVCEFYIYYFILIYILNFGNRYGLWRRK